MRQSQFSPYPQEIEHPRCDRCGVPMWLTQIQHDKPEHDKWTFKCPACESERTEIVKYR